jgi:hypothetical protein
MARGPASGNLACGGRATESGWGPPRVPTGTQLRIPHVLIPGVRTRGRISALERETAQTADQGPEDDAQWQRKWDRGDSRDVGLEAATISKVRNSSPVEPSRAENDGDSSVAPQSRIGIYSSGRRASTAASKPHGQRVVERRRVRMPERVTTRRVGSPSAESTRFPGEGQSAQGQSGPKARPKGVADGQPVNIPAPGGKVEGR